MYKNMSLKAKILSGSCITLILLVITGVIGIRATNSLTESSKWVEHTHEVIGEAKQILSTAVDMETGMRGYLLAGQEEFLDPYTQGKKDFVREIASLSKTVDDNPAQVQLLGEAKATIEEWVQKVTEPTIELRSKIGDAETMNDMAELIQKAKGKVYFDKFRSQISTFISREEKLMAKRQEKALEATADNDANAQLLKETSKWIEHTHEVIAQANAIIAAAVDMETGMRGYLLAGKEEFLDPYNSGKQRFAELSASLSKTVDDNPAQVQLLAEAKATIDEWREKVTEKQIALRRKIGDAETMDDMADLIAQAKGKVYFDKFRSQISTFIDREAKLMGERQKEATQTAANSFYLIVGTMVAAILIALIIAFLLAGSITRPFRQIFQGLKTFSNSELDTVRAKFKEVIDSLQSGGGQVASASQQIAEGTSQQASSLEETSSSLEEMASMTKANSANSGQADTLMKETKRVVEQANGSMNEVVASMDEISKASEETSKIVKTIDEIAFQTNLLALNAAVEAARAGEAGKGFAVVAEEVRNLAMRASEAAQNTSNLIEGTVKKVGEGSNLVGKTNEAFEQVAASAAKVAELISEISSASNEQRSGIEQVNTAVAEMDKVVQGNAANSEELSSQAEELNSTVGILLEIVEGSTGGQKGPAASSGATGKGRAALPRKTQTQTRARGKEAAPQGKNDPDQVIPLDDNEFEDF